MPGENQVLAKWASITIPIVVLSGCSASPGKPDISTVYKQHYAIPGHFGDYFFPFQHSFLNIVLFVLLFTAFQMWRNRRADYLYYALYLALTWLYFARAFPPYFYYFFSDIEAYTVFHHRLRAPVGGGLNTQTEFIFFHLLTAGYGLFVRAFFDLKAQDPKLDKVIMWFIRLSLGMSALLVVLLLGAGIYAGDGSPLMTLLKNAWLAPSAWLLWRAWKGGFPGGTYIIVGSMSLIASSVLVGLLHFSGDPLYGKRVYIQLGVLLEILLFSAALGQKDYGFQHRRRLAEEQAALAEERAQLALEKMEQLRSLEAAKTQLYTGVTHEFRSPLTVILGMADKIEESPKRWLREGVQAIRSHGRSLLRLVNQMLDLARLEAGSLPLRMIQGDINAHLRNLVESYRSYADTKKIELRFTVTPAQLVMDYDPDKIADILANLLFNALKFTPPGGAVTVSCKLATPSGLLLTVADTGPGIAPEKLPHIFDRFYQADDPADRPSEGTGIGLALVKELVKLLGGGIAAQSEPGKGTAFVVKLPIRNTAPRQEAPPVPKPPVLPADAQAFPRVMSKGKLPRALIVEDNDAIAVLLTAGLEGQYRIERAVNGQAGVTRAIELVPDVIISDVMMPEMDGFELCRTLKEDARTSHIPIILLTALADTASRVKGLEVGADAYLSKPFNQRELEICLRKSLELRDRLQQRYAGGKVPDQPEAEFSRDDAFVADLQAFLEAHYSDEKLTVEKMANALHFSQRQLGRKVKGLFGITPQLYLRRFRLKKARHLLRTTDKTITEIAHSTGFSGLAYFSRVFLEEFGVPPREWRVG